MTKTEFINKLDVWEINESEFYNGTQFVKESGNDFIINAFQGGYLPIYLTKKQLIQLINDEISITDLEF